MPEHPVALIEPEEVADQLAAGAIYLDVRTPEEFRAGHVPGAFNVPWLLDDGETQRKNPEFLAVVATLAGVDARLVVGCQAGGRSAEAARALAAAGYQSVADMRAGWDGHRDAFGRRTPGYSRRGLPVEPGDGGPRGWAALAGQRPRS